MLLGPECRYSTAFEGILSNVVKIKIDIVHNFTQQFVPLYPTFQLSRAIVLPSLTSKGEGRLTESGNA